MEYFVDGQVEFGVTAAEFIVFFPESTLDAKADVENVQEFLMSQHGAERAHREALVIGAHAESVNVRLTTQMPQQITIVRDVDEF